jgi:hypothetical protein
MTDFGAEIIRLRLANGDNIASPLVGSDTIINLSLGLLSSTVLYGRSFSPGALFSAGEQGAWYNPSDFTTMFQDSAGTTPVTAVEQPVGLLLDKSKKLAVGSELVTNGTFDVDTTGWTAGTSMTLTANAGNLRITRGASVNQNNYTSLTTVAGKTYRISWEYKGRSAGSTQYTDFRIGTTIGGTNLFRQFDSSASEFSQTTRTGYFVAAGTTTYVTILLRDGVSGDWIQADNISVREIAGNHAFQATSASRPVLSARVNQLLDTATLSTQNVTTLAATYTLSFSGAGTVTASGTNIGVYTAGSNSLVCTAGTLTLTVVGSVTFADLRVTNTGVGLPAYQAVVTSTDYDTTGFPLYLRFDGTDDFLTTASINPGAGVKAQMFAGVRVETPRSNNSAVWQFGDTTTTATDALLSILTGDGSTDSYRAALHGSGVNQTPRVTKVVPYTVVFSTLYDAAATGTGEISVRENGTVKATGSATDSGVTSFGSQVLYIGRQAAATGYLNGKIYSLVVRFGANLDATTITNTETWVNGKTYAYA